MISISTVEIGESDDEGGENARPLDKTRIDPDNSLSRTHISSAVKAANG